MTYNIQYTTDFSDAALQKAFRTYFAELGCRITNWDGLFAAMGEKGREYTWTHRDAKGNVIRFVSGTEAGVHDHALVLRDEIGTAAGFIQFTVMHMDSWFFTVKCGFIREFWIQSDLRRHGYGANLLSLAEAWLRDQGCLFALLTTDTAPDFYTKQGYMHQESIKARNKDAVFIKKL